MAGGKGAGGTIHAVAQQHGDGHGAHTAGHRGDALCTLSRLWEGGKGRVEQAG